MDQLNNPSATSAAPSEEKVTIAELMDPSAQDELAALKVALEAKENDRREWDEFAETFPGVSLADIPDYVKESAQENGLSLAAAYALYLCKREKAQAIARKAMEKAASQTPGLPSGDRGERFYSIDEMKSMSLSEVRRQYGVLLNSLSRGVEKIY